MQVQNTHTYTTKQTRDTYDCCSLVLSVLMTLAWCQWLAVMWWHSSILQPQHCTINKYSPSLQLAIYSTGGTYRSSHITRDQSINLSESSFIPDCLPCDNWGSASHTRDGADSPQHFSIVRTVVMAIPWQPYRCHPWGSCVYMSTMTLLFIAM